MTYFQWFTKEGWKRYAVPFLFAIIISLAFVINFSVISQGPLPIVILSCITIAGFDIGIVYHSILAYKAGKK